jgi:hypothetical protein
MIKSRRMRGRGISMPGVNVKWVHNSVTNAKGIGHLGDLCIHRLEDNVKMYLKIWSGNLDRIYLAQDMMSLRALVNMIMNLRIL